MDAAMSTPLKKRRVTADAMSSSWSSARRVEDDRHTAAQHSQLEARRRMGLPSRNLFEVQFL